MLEKTIRHLSEEDQRRAEIYAFLARRLRQPPGVADLSDLATLEGDATPFGQAFTELARVSAASSAAKLRDEFIALLGSTDQGGLVPFASYYLNGSRSERTIIELRLALSGLGIANRTTTGEPEDHISQLMDMMAGLITGAYGTAYSMAVQKALFQSHIAPWAEEFFNDLYAAPSASFYRPIGRIGALFIGFEKGALSLN
ncbi:MAG: TorD/DmsD family molecular chaperone [Mangrovicoccus sp.]